MFNHVNAINLPDLPVREVDGLRHYQSPNGVWLPSVTTVLGSIANPSLEKWKKKVGPIEANKISKRAIERGNIIHKLCETYLKNESIDKNAYMPWVWALFIKLKPFLNKLNNIHCLETTLYSNEIGLAGTVDCIGVYDEKILSVVDFKGSTRNKELENIESYCLQATAYSDLYKSITGIKIHDAFIVMAIEQENPKIFSIKVDDYQKKLYKIVNEFFHKYS